MNQSHKTYFLSKLLIVLFTLSLIFASIGPAYSSLPTAETKKIQTTKYNNYYIKLEPLENSLVYSKLSIINNSKELFSEEGVINLSKGDNLETINDLNDINYPILIVDSYSGGAHCCYTVSFLNLENNFSILGEFNGVHSAVTIQKLENNLGFKITLRDWNYAYRWTSFASSHAPEVVLYYVKNKQSVAIEEMRKRGLTNQELQNLINNIKSRDYSNFKYAYNNDTQKLSFQEAQVHDMYFGKLLEAVLDLIYSGNASQARKVIDMTWPSSKESKKMFLRDLKQAIQESNYYNDLVILNKLSPDFELN